MKIIELRFKNLNSLYGEWFIDFTQPEYTSNGIFALTGPTGAGKSTILDALCLGLYGRTPRLGKISKSSNEIMSRQTGECFAEVLFESRAGRFRCHWSQHRARKKAEGDLQNPKHEIAEGGEEGQIIENQIRRVAEVVEEKTGMDFDRFTRSILLAQGGFDTFLKADEEEKSKILEQITGTEIYSDISISVHDRLRQEKEKQERLKAEISGIELLKPEEETAVRQQIESKQKEETALRKRIEETEKAIHWLKSIDQLKTELEDSTNRVEELQTAMAAFRPKRQQLNRALKAAELEGQYATLKALRNQQTSDRKILQNEQELLPQIQESVAKQKELWENFQKKAGEAKEKSEKALPLIKQVRRLDEKLSSQKNDIQRKEENFLQEEKKIAANRQTLNIEVKKEQKIKIQLGLIQNYLNTNVQDEKLIAELAGIKEQLNNLSARQGEILQQETKLKQGKKTLKKEEKQLNELQKQCQTKNQEVKEAAHQLTATKSALDKVLAGKLLREYRQEMEHLQEKRLLREKIAALEDHRKRLEDGKPCPLCGAEHHPYAEGNVPVFDDLDQKIKALTELIEKAENLETEILQLENKKAAVREKALEEERRAAAAELAQKNRADRFEELSKALQKDKKEFDDLKQRILKKLAPYNILEIPPEKIDSVVKKLIKRLEIWQDHLHQKAEAEKQQSTTATEIKRLNAIIETQTTALEEKQAELKSLKKEHQSDLEERQKLYGEKNPDHVEKLLKDAIAAAENSVAENNKKYHETTQQLTTVKTKIESLNSQISDREPKLEKLQAAFIQSLISSEFSDEAQFVQALLPSDRKKALSAEAKALDDQAVELKTRQQEFEKRLKQEISKNITNKNQEELLPIQKENKTKYESLHDEIAGLNHQLKTNLTAKDRIQEKQTAIEIQEKEFSRWERLHNLIGSADGKKYRSFAQGLTFELMVSHANQQLQKMTDRYWLVRDETRPLELNVMDTYQAGEIRSTRNLSGGESFIVSLTLALGLSKMASRKVRVDSLFLDEGFGSLDEEALETALETLAGLNQEGKLIGIISHVSALKERISTQINIVPLTGGKSEIIGAGCKKISR